MVEKAISVTNALPARTAEGMKTTPGFGRAEPTQVQLWSLGVCPVNVTLYEPPRKPNSISCRRAVTSPPMSRLWSVNVSDHNGAANDARTMTDPTIGRRAWARIHAPVY